MKDQAVTLKDSNGNIILTLIGYANGQLSFSKKLLDVAYYAYYLRDKKIGDIMPGFSKVIYLDQTNENIEKGFNFSVMTVDNNEKFVSDKAIQNFDITDGSPKLLNELKTDSNGKANFSNLPLNRNLAISVDGINQGYTLRPSEADSNKSAVFTVDGKDEELVDYSKENILVTVRDEEGEPLPNQNVQFKKADRTIVFEGKTDEKSQVIANDKLMDSNFYHVFVNGTKLRELTPRNDVSIYLNADQIDKDSEEAKEKVEDSKADQTNEIGDVEKPDEKSDKDKSVTNQMLLKKIVNKKH